MVGEASARFPGVILSRSASTTAAIELARENMACDAKSFTTLEQQRFAHSRDPPDDAAERARQTFYSWREAL